MKRLITLLVVCVLLLPAITAVSSANDSSPAYLSRGNFVQAMYETYVEHSGITVRQEQARTRQVPPSVIMTGGFGTCFYFDDIDFLNPLFDATGWTYLHDISNGTGTGEYNINVFSPDQAISIQEALTMAYRMVVNSDNRPELSKDSDLPLAPAWAQDAIQWWTTVDPEPIPLVPTDRCDSKFVDKLFSVIYSNYTIIF